MWYYFHVLSNGAAFVNTPSRSSQRSYANSCHYRRTIFRFQNCVIISSAIMNMILRRFSVNYGLVYLMLLYLKVGDGDLLLITEPALLT